MTLDELHEISPEHAQLADQISKDNNNQMLNGECGGNEDGSLKSEGEGSDRKDSDDIKIKTGFEKEEN